MIGQQLVPDFAEQGSRHQAIAWLTGRSLSNVRSRPDKLIHFGSDDPARGLVIKSQAGTSYRGYQNTLVSVRWSVCNGADSDKMLACVNNHYGTGAILSPLDKAFAIFVGPEIRVLNYITRANWDGIGQSVHLVIELGRLGRWLGRQEQPDRLFIEVARQNNLTIAGLQASVLVRRNQDRRRLPMAENLYRFALGITKYLAKLALGIRCFYLGHH